MATRTWRRPCDDDAIVVDWLSRLDKARDDGRISPKDIVDVETSEAIERINDNVSELRAELRDGLAGVRTELNDGLTSVRTDVRAEITGLRTDLRTEMAELRSELRAEMAELRSELRAEIREGVAEAKRHGSILFESLQDQNRLLADGFAAVNARLDKIDTRRR